MRNSLGLRASTHGNMIGRTEIKDWNISNLHVVMINIV